MKTLQNRNFIAKNVSLPERDLVFLDTFVPVITDFARWVIDEAVKSGKKRLYFLARDAYLPYVAARFICEKLGYEIDCRYLYVSRYSLRSGDFYICDDYLDKICANGIDVSFKKVMRRAMLDDAEIAAIAEICDYSDKIDTALSREELAGLKDKLSDTSEFAEAVYSHSKEAFPNVREYLQGTGFFDGIDFAIVDSGWIGSLQQTIERILSFGGEEKTIEGYYFGLYEIPNGTDINRYHTYYFRPYRDVLKKVFFSNCLFETVASAPNGMAVGYRPIGGFVQPVFASMKSLNIDFELRAVELINMYLDSVELDTIYKKSNRIIKPMIALMKKPSALQLEAFGNLEFCDDVLENTVLKIAEELSDEELDKPHIVKAGWTEGSIVRSGKAIGRRLFLLRLYKVMSYFKKLVLHG